MNLLEKYKDRNFSDLVKCIASWDPYNIKGSTTVEIISTDVYIDGEKIKFSTHSPFTPLKNMDYDKSKVQLMRPRFYPDPDTGNMIDAYFRLNGMKKPFVESCGRPYMKVDSD